MGVIIIVAIIIAVLIVAEYNKLAHLNNKVKQSKSGIDVFLTKRFDLIPNLVNVVKGYMTHEQNTLQKITELRTLYMRNGKNINTASEINSELKSIFLVGEKYPELKSSEHFIKLQDALIDTEDDIQAARRLYNSDVTLFNTQIQKFPTNILANICGYKEYDVFVADEISRANINVKI